MSLPQNLRGDGGEQTVLGEEGWQGLREEVHTQERGPLGEQLGEQAEGKSQVLCGVWESLRSEAAKLESRPLAGKIQTQARFEVSVWVATLGRCVSAC